MMFHWWIVIIISILDTSHRKNINWMIRSMEIVWTFFLMKRFLIFFFFQRWHSNLISYIFIKFRGLCTVKIKFIRRYWISCIRSHLRSIVLSRKFCSESRRRLVDICHHLNLARFLYRRKLWRWPSLRTHLIFSSIFLEPRSTGNFIRQLFN